MYTDKKNGTDTLAFTSRHQKITQTRQRAQRIREARLSQIEHKETSQEIREALIDCGSCGADIGESNTFVWHYDHEDCRAIREPVKGIR